MTFRPSETVKLCHKSLGRQSPNLVKRNGKRGKNVLQIFMKFCMIDREEKFPHPLSPPPPPLPSPSRKSEPSSLRGNSLPFTAGSITKSMTLVLLLNLKYFPVSATLCGSFFRRSAIFKEEF